MTRILATLAIATSLMGAVTAAQADTFTLRGIFDQVHGSK